MKRQMYCYQRDAAREQRQRRQRRFANFHAENGITGAMKKLTRSTIATLLLFPMFAGIAHAQSVDGFISTLDRVDRGQAESTITELAQRAGSGDIDAQYWYGRYLHDVAPLSTRDFTAGREWLERASTAGHGRASAMLARIHEVGFIVPRNEDEAARYYGRALEQGVAEAGHQLARMEFAKDDRDGASILRALTAAAELGHPQSVVDLAFLHASGTLSDVDGEAAFRWANRGVELGMPRAMNLLARLYANGVGVAPDAAEALKWAILARENGDADGATIAQELTDAVPEYVQREARERARAWTEANGG
jgi:TPR repeat protein